MKRWTVLFAAVLLAGAQAPAPDVVVAQGGSGAAAVSLTAADARRLLDIADPDQRAQAQQDAALIPRLVRNQVLQMLLLNEARARQWDQSPEVILRANQARDAAIVSSYVASLTAPPADYPSDTEIQVAYEANKPRLMVPRQYQLAQIFVALPANPPRGAEDEAQKKLRDIRAQLAKPHADFTAIARRASDDHGSADKGGEIGWLRDDALAQPIRDTVAGMPDNAISDPVRMPDGWHILHLLATRPASPAALATVREQLVRALRQQRAAQNERALLDDLQRRQPIQLDEIQLQKLVTQKPAQP